MYCELLLIQITYLQYFLEIRYFSISELIPVDRYCQADFNDMFYLSEIFIKVKNFRKKLF